MKHVILAILLLKSTVFCSAQSFSFLEDLQNGRLEFVNREYDEASPKRIKITEKKGDGLLWITSYNFIEGNIDFDAKGLDLSTEKYIGLAFYGQNDTAFQALCISPYALLNEDYSLRKNAIKYYASPIPKELNSACDENAKLSLNRWIHIRLQIKNKNVEVYVDNNPSPAFSSQLIDGKVGGKFGVFLSDGAGGEFGNIKITP
ncbi:hypothetical protein [Emticicia sp. SJ17W-69]|uniref:hypothetical protein n=1 Tax=Emticicia sp. SJ17W-69 TaxID=3421657 RepID=UPI003EBE1400